MAEVEQLDKLEQYTEGDQADGELGELSQRFYQAAVQVSSRKGIVHFGTPGPTLPTKD